MKPTTQTIQDIHLNKRKSNSHKGDYGHALLITGDIGSMGASVISGKACLRSGVGLLSINCPKEERAILQTSIPEAMVVFREEKKIDFSKYSAIGIGSGMGVNDESKELIHTVLTQSQKPILVDADAITLLSQNKELINILPKNTVITPHPKEFDRLFGEHENLEKRIETSLKKAKELQIIIVLKGHETYIISKDEMVKNTTGNAGLAKGGSGDALTGIITSFLAQNYEPFIAAKIGVFIHGLSADIALENQTMESLLISDVIESLGKAFCKIHKANSLS
jgi:NAD(P)H-hydrate epimerase